MRNRSFPITLACVGGCAGTLGEDLFSDFVAELPNPSRDGAPSLLAAGRGEQQTHTDADPYSGCNAEGVAEGLVVFPANGP